MQTVGTDTEIVAGSDLYKDGGWRISTVRSPAKTLHLVFKSAPNVLCIGIEAQDIPNELLDTLLKVIDLATMSGGFLGEYGLLSARVGSFTLLGHLSGELRRLGRGWINAPDARIVQVFPCFKTELRSDWDASQFSSVARSLDLFNLGREPSPYLEITMRGTASGLWLPEWEATKLQTALTYADILSEEQGSTLDVRNIFGVEMSLGGNRGWENYRDRILFHLL